MSKILFLNGPSSAGKSSIAREIQAQASVPLWLVSSDQFVAAGLLPPRRTETGAFSWREQRPLFFDAFHRALPALASPGNHLIVEHVIEKQEWMSDLVSLLREHDVFFVGVTCVAKVQAQRERQRGDRSIGEGAAHVREGVHRRAAYDFQVESSLGSPAQLAAEILAAWASPDRRSVFKSLVRAGDHTHLGG